MGDWNCLLFEDLPRNRIMRWSEAEGVSIYREPSHYANGQTRARNTDYEGARQRSEQPPALYHFDPATGDIRIAASDFDGPNGLAFSPDETTLYVAETGNQADDNSKQFIRVFAVGDGGALSGGGVFAKVEPGY